MEGADSQQSSSGGMGAWGWGALAASVGTGLLAYFGQKDTNERNVEQAQTQMNFQREMSDTAVQRRVGDLQTAGLNPMLAYSGVASSPEGSKANLENSIGSGLTHGKDSFSAAMLARQQVAMTNKIVADTEVSKAQVANTNADTNLKVNSAGKAAADTEYVRATIPKIIEEIRELQGRTDTHWSQSHLADAKASEIQSLLPSIVQSLLLDNKRKELHLPALENMSNAEKTWWRQNFHQHLPDLLDSINSVTGLGGAAVIIKKLFGKGDSRSITRGGSDD